MLLQSSTFLIHFQIFFLFISHSLSLSLSLIPTLLSWGIRLSPKKDFPGKPKPKPKPRSERSPPNLPPHFISLAVKIGPKFKDSIFRLQSLSLSLSFFSWKHNTIIFRLKNQPLFISFSSTFVLSHLDFSKKRKKNKTKKYPFDDPESRVFIRWLLGFL